jgi:predicted nuclease of restriction endonuclease-like RecB superfamily
MLRGEHVMARLVRGRLIPHRLSPEEEQTREIAEALVDLYAGHRGEPRTRLEAEVSLLEEELGARLDPRRGFRIVRSLAKLLEERAEWAPSTESDPYTLRTRIFELAAALPEFPSGTGTLLGDSREEVLSRIVEETGIEDPTSLMYADRQGAQLLSGFERPSPEALISRYNVAQVQGVLYAARDLAVELGEEADARLVFHYVKLLGLIYRLESSSEGYRLLLDGPLSLFGGTRKYGLRLAKFLPGLLLTSPWKLHANVSWKGRESILELDSRTSGLASHYRGPTDAMGEEDVREAFRRAWDRAKDTEGWELEPGGRILPVPPLKTALVPDFAIRNASTGEEVRLEVLGFWSERYLMERVALLREAAKRGHRVLVAAPESLGATPETLTAATHGYVVPFKNRLDVKSVLAALRKGEE